MENRKATSFNIEKAKSGYEVCTRDGRPVRILCFDAMGDYPIIALVKNKNTGKELIALYTSEGKYSGGLTQKNCRYDLMVVSVCRIRFVNIYADCYGERYCAPKLYPCEESAKAGSVTDGEQSKYITTVPITWYE